VAGAAAAALLSRAPSSRPGPEGPLVLPRYELLHALFAAQQQMVADYYWVRTTEAMGSAVTAADHLDIYHYGKLVTDLDPDFRYVYAFVGAGVPARAGPREEWVNTRESTEIMERGLVRFPKYVMLRILLAYNYSSYHRDYRRAAEILAETARIPDAPVYLGALAARLLAVGGEMDTAMAIARDLAETAPDPETRERMARRVLELEAEQVFRDVDQQIAAFQKAEGRPPAGVAELKMRGYLPHGLVDPLGGEITIGQDGRAYSSVWNDRMQIHDVDAEVREYNEYMRKRQQEREQQQQQPQPQPPQQEGTPR
jgi:hypothetical protein